MSIPQATAIELNPRNYQHIALRTVDASVSDLQLALESAPQGTWYVVRDYTALDGTHFATWTMMSLAWLETYFEFDQQKSKVQYVPITKRRAPLVRLS